MANYITNRGKKIALAAWLAGSWRTAAADGSDAATGQPATLYMALASALPGPLGTLVGKVPGPVFPDPGHPLQLVHHDDVAAAIAVTVTTDAEPGAFNIAGDGTVTLSTVASALGAIPVRVPAVLGTAASATLRRLPFVPSLVEWIHVARTSVVMDTSKAKRELGWHPRYSSKATLDELVASL